MVQVAGAAGTSPGAAGKRGCGTEIYAGEARLETFRSSSAEFDCISKEVCLESFGTFSYVDQRSGGAFMRLPCRSAACSSEEAVCMA
jgi:hypothetical protein